MVGLRQRCLTSPGELVDLKRASFLMVRVFFFLKLLKMKTCIKMSVL